MGTAPASSLSLRHINPASIPSPWLKHQTKHRNASHRSPPTLVAHLPRTNPSSQSRPTILSLPAPSELPSPRVARGYWKTPPRAASLLLVAVPQNSELLLWWQASPSPLPSSPSTDNVPADCKPVWTSPTPSRPA